MRFIPTNVHGVIDYLAGIMLIAAPWLFGFADYGPAMWVPILAGCVMLVAAAFTDYELGLVRRIPMTAHLTMDAVLGLVLAASPWIFQFYEVVWIPHVVVGLAEVMGAVTTQTHPSRRSGGSALGMG